MKHMEVNVTADSHRGSHGYEGAVLMLPASVHEIQDALQRAHVAQGGGYELHCFNGWPQFMTSHLILSGKKSLEELSLLADQVSRMDEFQIGTYEGALHLCREAKGDTPITTKELINLAFSLDDYEYHPGVTNDTSLGRACMEGGMLDIVESLSDEAVELLDPAKVGKALRNSDHGAFTPRGYVYRSSTAARREFYDGEHLPSCGDSHSGLLSLRIEKADAPDGDSGIWLELPADEKALQWALLSIGEESFDACRIAETRSIIPAFQYQLAGDEDIGKLNTLAGRLQELRREAPDDLMLMKYKAVLELEQCFDLDMALDITANLGCYDFGPDILSPDAYGEYVLQSAGIDTGDPAFSRFDFRGYGKRQIEQAGFVFTPYGAISRNGQEFVHEYTGQEQQGKLENGMAMQ